MRDWSPRRVLLACVAWIVGAPILAMVSVAISAWMEMREMQRRATGDGLYGVSIGLPLDGWAFVAGEFLPPLVLVAVWLVARRRRP